MILALQAPTFVFVFKIYVYAQNIIVVFMSI